MPYHATLIVLFPETLKTHSKQDVIWFAFIFEEQFYTNTDGTDLFSNN